MEALACDHLVQALHHQLSALPDDRQGQHTRDASNEAALGALAVFLTPSPAFLADQRTMPQTTGRSHAERLFGLGDSPGDQPIRTWLDPVAPAQLSPVCAVVDAAREAAGPVAAGRGCADPRRMALAGPAYCSSQALHWARGSQRPHTHGRVTSVHHALTPVLVAPGPPAVSTVAPACITPPDGQAQQAGEQVAAKRWMARQVGRDRAVPLVGDALDCTPPCCDRWRRPDDHGSVVCTPASHTTRYAGLAGVDAAGDRHQVTSRRWHGRLRPVSPDREATDVPVRTGEDAWGVKGCALPITQETAGTILDRQAFATPHHRDHTTVASVVQAGRARWKIAHEHHQVLTTPGDHREPHDGHGTHHRSAG